MRYPSLSLKDLVCLLCANPCHDEVWEEFVSRVGKPISLRIMRRASLKGECSLSLVEDLRQDTYVKLLQDGYRHLRDFAIQHPEDEAILGYLRRTAVNITLDYFKHVRTQKRSCDKPHVAMNDVDLKARDKSPGSQEEVEFEILLKQIDEHLKHRLTEPDAERDRTIFWFYFRQGWSTKEIASLANTGLTAKGVGSVIERLTRCIREQILGIRSNSDDDGE